MTPLDCLILEDDVLAAKLLEHLIAADERMKLSCTLSSLEAAVAYFQQNQPPDILFLDVELDGRQGFEIMQHVPATTSVILTTAHEIYAFDGYEIGAIDFLKKPLNKERFTKAVNKAIQHHSATASPVYITIASGKQVYRFRKEEIYSVESVKDYVRVTTTNSNQLFLCTMKYLEELLEPQGFLRINKSFIINLQHITHVKGAQVYCNNGVCFSIGRAFRQKVTSALERSGNTGTH